ADQRLRHAHKPTKRQPATADTSITQVHGSRLNYLDPHVVSVTSVAQALASSGHGIAVLTDQPLFGLTAIPIRVPDGILSVTLYAGWDSNHFAASGAASLVESIINYHRTLPALS
ncbi:hypothetical protein ACP8WZ_37040, partial [Mycolicibacterium nivoides]